MASCTTGAYTPAEIASFLCRDETALQGLNEEYQGAIALYRQLLSAGVPSNPPPQTTPFATSQHMHGAPPPTYQAPAATYQPGGGVNAAYQPGGGLNAAYQPGGGVNAVYQPGGVVNPAYQVGGGANPTYQVGGGANPTYQPGGGANPTYQPGGGANPAYQPGSGMPGTYQPPLSSSSSGAGLQQGSWVGAGMCRMLVGTANDLVSACIGIRCQGGAW